LQFECKVREIIETGGQAGSANLVICEIVHIHLDENILDEHGEIDTDKIDLDEYIRDYAVLAVPMKNLCSEDCKGLCPKCGKNLNEGTCNCSEENIDPRWESIQKLKTKNN